MSVWEQKGRYAPRTRTVTGAILAPHEIQRLVVSGKTGHQVLRRESETGFACLLTRAAKWRPLIRQSMGVMPRDASRPSTAPYSHLKSDIEGDNSMRWNLTLLLFFALSSNSCFAYEAASVASFDAYYGGNRYEYKVTPGMIEDAPRWSPEISPYPPVSAAAALAKGEACIHEIPIKSGESWELRELALSPTAGGWIWIARYRLVLKGRPMTGYWPTLFCPILMDGTTVKPIITKHDM